MGKLKTNQDKHSIPMLFKYSLGMILLACSTSTAYATENTAADPQTVSRAKAGTKTVSGTVTDADGNPLIGATVKVKGTSVTTATDIDGRFTIKCSPGDKLDFNYIGYLPAVATVGADNTYSIAMTEDSKLLDEVVVVGYGTMKKSDISGSVASVDTKEMMRRNPTNIAIGLQGAAAGVRVNRTSGDPSGGAAIQIRGIATINGSADPIYVVDGVEVGTNADFVNPADIERIEVLKDASATAIYGARGANGVIMVTTKKGVAGHSTVTLNATFGIAQMRGKLKVADAQQFAYAIREGRKGDNTLLTNEVFNEENSARMRTIDWQDAMTHTALQQNYTLSTTGGSENTQSAFSVGYLDNEGILIESRYRRFTALANIAHKVKGIIEMGGTVAYKYTEARGGGNLRNYATLTPSLDYVDPATGEYITNDYHQRPDGTWPVFWQISTDGMEIQKSQDNPYAAAKTADTTPSRENRLVGNAYLQLNLFKGFNIKTIASYIYKGNDNATFTLPTADRLAGGTSYNQFSMSQSQWHKFASETYATYHWENSVNDLTVMAGYSFSNNYGHSINASGIDFYSNDFRDLGLAAKTSDNKGGGKFELSTRLVSYFGRATYSFKDRYILTATVRRDGSSNFGSGNRFGTFPSVAAAWRATEEKFLRQIDWLSNLKVRVGWGRTGNSGTATSSATPQLSTDRTSFDWGHLNGLLTDYTKVPGMTQKRESDTNLKWETNTQTNFGLDLGFLNNELTVNLDYFIRKTSDLLVYRQIRNSTGFNSVYTNIGDIQNQGLEFSVAYNKRLGDWTLGATITGSTLKNKVKRLLAPVYSSGYAVNDGQYDQWSNHSISEEGGCVGAFYGYVVEGIFRSQDEIDALNAAAVEQGWASYQGGAVPGDYKFADVNGDGHVNDSDRTVLGNGLPDLNYSLNLTAQWRNWDFSMFMYGVAGQKIFSYSAMKMGQLYKNHGGVNNPLVEYIDNAWSESNPNGTASRFTITDPNGNRRASSAYIKNGDFLKIGNIQLGYTLPQRLMDTLKMTNARLYFAVENVACFSSYNKYGDPEVGTSKVLLQGWDGGRYPSPRIYTFGLNLSF